MKLILLFISLLLAVYSSGQTGAMKVYSPGANAETDLVKTLNAAKSERKNVLIITGGNWCSWCMEFNRVSHADAGIDSLLSADYIVYHLNYSPENKNLRILAKYKYPQRFGFPVFLVLDDNGNLIHTQNTTYLQQGKSYNTNKVKQFLLNWNRAALSPANYKNF